MNPSPVVAAALLAVLSLSGCSGGADADLATEPTTSASGAPVVEKVVIPHHPWVSGAMPVRGTGYGTIDLDPICLRDGTDPIRIRSVEPIDPEGGAVVTDFSVFYAGPQGHTGAAPRRLRTIPDLQGTKLVKQSCGSDEDALAVELRKPRHADAVAHGFLVTYVDSSGARQSVEDRYRVRLCDTCRM